MPYRLLSDDTIEVDTADELEGAMRTKRRLALAEKTAQVQPMPAPAAPAPAAPAPAAPAPAAPAAPAPAPPILVQQPPQVLSEEDRAMACISKMKGHAQSFFRFLRTRPEGVMLDEMRQHLGLKDNVAASGVVSGCHRSLTIAQIDPAEMFTTLREGSRRDRTIKYVPGPLTLRLPL